MPDCSFVRRWCLTGTILVAAFGWAGSLAAETYPVRPITMIVPFPAGGATDTLARFLAENMRERLGQPIIIENVGGAAGTIGVARAVRAAPDGYTLSIGTSTTHMLTGGLYSLSFDLLKDIEPIIYIGSEPLLLAARKDFPADDLKGLMAYLKANPDNASVGIAGVGATGHLAGIAFQKETGTKFQFVPYRGNGPAMQDLLARQIDFMMEPSSNFKALIATDSIKPIAVTGKTRLPASPDIPTVEEAGLPNFTASLWYALWVPKDTPKDIVEKLNATLRDVLADASVQKHFDDLGIGISPRDQQSPEALRAFQKAEAERWWPVIKASGLKAE